MDDRVALTLEMNRLEVRTTLHEENLELPDFMERLVEPMLLAAGYPQKAVDEYWGRDT